MVNARYWLDKVYPLEKRSEIKELDISEKELKGWLDLTDFTQLTELDCSNNYLTGITFSRDSKLVYLDITNNNFSQNIEIFSQLINLKEIFIKNELKYWKSSGKENLITKYKFQNGIYNKFFGSLKALKFLNKLERLDISNTKIDSGLEYLPVSLKWFYCQNIPCEKVKEWIKTNVYRKEEMLKEEDERARKGLFSCLTSYFSLNIADCSHDLKIWREKNLLSINNFKKNDSLLEICIILKKKIFNHEKEVKILDIVSFYLEEEIIKFRKEFYAEQQNQIEILSKNNQLLLLKN